MVNWFVWATLSLFCTKTDDAYLILPSLSRVSFWLVLFTILRSPEQFNGTWLALITVLLGYIMTGKIVANKEKARMDNCE